MSLSKHHISVLTKFPEIDGRDFNLKTYLKQFNHSTLIVKAQGTNVEYDQHWGVLSIKCAFNGTEYYNRKGCTYAVSDDHYLVLNKDSLRSSWINSKNEVSSFTISFSPQLELEMLSSLKKNDEANLDDPVTISPTEIRLAEKLYKYGNDSISRMISDLYYNHEFMDSEELAESLIVLLQELCGNQKKVEREIREMRYIKSSTRQEIYDRLSRSKDFIISNFATEIRLEAMAEVACLNPYYFLREFKRLFKITPHKYLQKLRLEKAKDILSATDKNVVEVCQEVGFSDPSSFSKLYKKVYLSNPSRR